MPGAKTHPLTFIFSVLTVAPPEEELDDGVRRSHRTRVKPLNWFLGERIHYQEDPEQPGVYMVDGIEVPPNIPETKMITAMHRAKKRRAKKAVATTSHVSMHITPPDIDEVVDNPSTIPVINPANEEEALVGK